MATSYLVAAARTPIGAFLGSLSSLRAADLGAIAIRAAIERAHCDAGSINEVIMGNVLQAGSGQAPARQAALKAGLPSTIAAVTVNKVCGSGLKAVMLADQAIRCGDAECVVAGGMESMSQAPHLAQGIRFGQKYGDLPLRDAMVQDGLWCAFEDCHMGNLAEHTAATFSVTRQEQDLFAAESQRRAAKAADDGRFDDELVAVKVTQGRQATVVTADECPRPDTTLERLAELRPAFDPQGSVTAGNASKLSDGAAAVVVTNDAVATRLTTPWKAQIVATYTSGLDPKDVLMAPVDAVRGVLERADLRVGDVDYFEINEAFAAQMVACIRELDIDPKKVNPRGGAIALGHPIGASGARVLVTLLHALVQENLHLGVAALCLGGGNAVSMVVRR